MYSVNLRCERPLRDFQKGNISKSKLAEIRLSGEWEWGAVEQISKLGAVEQMQRWSNLFGARNRKRSHPDPHVLPFSNSSFSPQLISTCGLLNCAPLRENIKFSPGLFFAIRIQFCLVPF